jgi:FMN phosphatase YigB (HAD superfamily)
MTDADQSQSIVFLFDVDNTLLDNDSIVEDLAAHLEGQFGSESRARYFDLFEELRAELGYADYLGALQRYRLENPRDVRLLGMSSFLIDYPFTDRLYPHALEVMRRCRRCGRTAVLSDGDVVFQPWKVKRSGIQDAAEDNVLIYIHKEQVLDEVERHYPARHYVMIDDKPRLVTAIKDHWRQRVTTVMPRQGHYALDPKAAEKYPPADVVIERIGDLLAYDLPALVSSARPV